MPDLGTVVEVAQAVNSIGRLNKEVGNMVSQATGQNSSNGHVSSNNGKVSGKSSKIAGAGSSGRNVHGDADFAELYKDDFVTSQSASKAPACYQKAMEYLEEFSRLQRMVDYRGAITESKALQIVEQLKAAAKSITSRGIFKALNRIVPAPTPPLEDIVSSQIEMISPMQKHIKQAIHYSKGVVKKLEEYDHETLAAFDTGRKGLQAAQKRLGRTEKSRAELEEMLTSVPKSEANYVPLKTQFDDLKREEAELNHKLEVYGQQIVYTDKQTELIKSKEEVIRKGLHEFSLMNTYIIGFTDFMQNTMSADAIIPQLADMATAAGVSYTVLRGLFERRNRETTGHVRDFADAVAGVNPTVFPGAKLEATKQKSLLERSGRKLVFRDQALKVLGSTYLGESPEAVLKSEAATETASYVSS